MLPSIPLLHLLSFLLPSLLLSSPVSAAPSYSPISHLPLLGPPTLPSQIHRIPGENKTVILLSNERVVGGLNPGNGEIVWRQLHEGEDAVVRHASSGRVTATLSGPSGSHLRLYTPHTGDLLLEKQLHPSKETDLFGSVGSALQFVGDDLVVLSGGNEVRRVGKEGLVWTWTGGEDDSQLYLYSTPTHVHLLGLSLSTSHRTHTVLSLLDGSLLHSAPLALPHHLAGEPLMVHPGVVVEVQEGKLLSLSLDLEGKHKPHTLSGKWDKIVDVGLATSGLLVGIKEDGSSRVLRAEKDGSLLVLWEFADSKRSSHYTDSIFSGAVDKQGNAHIGRMYWTHTLNMASFHLCSAPTVGAGKIPGQEQGMVSGFTFPFQTKAHGTMTSFTLEVAYPPQGPPKPVPRFLLHTSTGAVQLWQSDKLQWSREEGLGELVGGVAWADVEGELPSGAPVREVQSAGSAAKKVAGMGELGVGDAPESVGERWARQLGDVWKLPGYTIAFALRFAESVLPSSSTSSSGQLQHALHKLALLASSKGKIYALSTSPSPAKGVDVVWERILGISGAPDGVGEVSIKKVMSVGGVGWVVLGERKDQDGIKTAAWSVTPSTGAIHPPPGREGTTNGLTLFPGTLAEAFLLPSDGLSANETVVLISQDRQVFLYPDDEARLASVQQRAGKGELFFSLPFKPEDVSLDRATLEGFTLLPTEDGLSALQTYKAHLTPSPNSQLLSLTRPSRGKVASFGRVLGSKKTLYKYLNPHLVVALTQSAPSPAAFAPDGSSTAQADGEWCGIHLVDEVSGSMLYESSVRKPAGRPCEIRAVMADNWLVWHFWNDGDSGAAVQGGGMRTKGWRVVVVELYEGEADEVTRSAELSSFAANSTRVHAISQTYGFPTAWNAVTMTSTKYGITLKDIVVANDRAQIQAYPHALLDPRRPVGKPTSAEKEELLVPFDSVIPDDPRRTVSQNYQVLGVNQLSTTPTALESTSLLLATGVDLFLARLSPSSTFDILSEGFNKTQLILTILALVVGIAVVKPIVESKKVQQRWYSTT